MTLAQADGDSPESTPATPSSTSSSSGTSSSGSSTSSSGSSNTATPSHKSNAGAIAGGVVGGIVALLLIGLLVFFLLRRRRASTPDRVAPGAYEQGAIDPPMTATSDTMAGSYNGNMNQKPYNPSDPSTFPGSAMSYGTSNNAAYGHDYTSPQHATHDPSVTSGEYNNSYPNTANHSPAPGVQNAPGRHMGYSGVAEL